MQPQDLASRVLPASICETLHQFASEGVPTDCGPEWPQDVKEHALEGGPHASAMSPENVELIWDDIRYQEKDGFVHKVTEAQLAEVASPNLKIFRVPLPAFFHSLRGKLGFATNCIPCLRGIMTPLNRGMAYTKEGIPPRKVGLPRDSDIRRALVLSIHAMR